MSARIVIVALLMVAGYYVPLVDGMGWWALAIGIPTQTVVLVVADRWDDGSEGAR